MAAVEAMLYSLKRGDVVVMDHLPGAQSCRCARSLRRPVEPSFPSIRRTSIRSRWRSANSKRIYEKQPSEPFRIFTQDRLSRGRVQSASVRQLLPTCRLRFHVTGIRSSQDRPQFLVANRIVDLATIMRNRMIIIPSENQNHSTHICYCDVSCQCALSHMSYGGIHGHARLAGESTTNNDPSQTPRKPCCPCRCENRPTMTKPLFW